MSSIFTKALSMFVEFEDDGSKTNSNLTLSNANIPVEVMKTAFSKAEAEKFEKHFDKLFDQANVPGPDYFEFYKMMDTLEAHIADEKVLLKATFDSLSIQGLTKLTLLETAKNYKAIIETDKYEFEKALGDKIKQGVGAKKSEITDLEKLIIKNNEQIQKLNNEILGSQNKIESLGKEVIEEEGKLKRNSQSYTLASQAIINKIAADIEKISMTL